MIELYWITRLDMISGWMIAFSVISGIFLVISLIAYFNCHYNYIYNDKKHDDEKHWNDFWANKIKVLPFAFILFLISSILTPNTKEAYMIYGIGTTLDYIKNDSTAQQIPHEAIEAINSWVKSLNIENKSHK